MLEERFKIGKWKLIDIVFAEGICENCKKPITYLYFIEDEKGNKCAVGSECFKQIALRIPPRARQYIDLKERVLKNIELILKNNIQAIDYRRSDGIASLAYPDVFINNRRTGAVYLKIIFNSGASREPRFDVAEETINELLKMGWKEYQEPRGVFGHESNRFIVLDPAKAQEIEKALISKGWKVYEHPGKKYKIGYYREQREQSIEAPVQGVREAMRSNDVMKFLVRGYTWKARMSNGAVFEWWTPQKVDRQTAKEELLKIANAEYGYVYAPKDIVSIWETKGGVI